MTTQLSNLDIKQLMPPSIVTDEVVAALCDAFQIELDQIVAEIINILFLPRVDQLSGDILEHLAWGLNIDADEGWLLATDDTKKRDLIKNAVAIQRNKGTKYAVKKALEVVGLTGTISEWFEYGGAPYWFRVSIDGTQAFTPGQLELLDRYIIKNKNVRSWVSVTVKQDFNTNKQIAAAALEVVKLNLLCNILNVQRLGVAVAAEEYSVTDFVCDFGRQVNFKQCIVVQDINVFAFIVDARGISETINLEDNFVVAVAADEYNVADIVCDFGRHITLKHCIIIQNSDIIEFACQCN